MPIFRLSPRSQLRSDLLFLLSINNIAHRAISVPHRTAENFCHRILSSHHVCPLLCCRTFKCIVPVSLNFLSLDQSRQSLPHPTTPFSYIPPTTVIMPAPSRFLDDSMRSCCSHFTPYILRFSSRSSPTYCGYFTRSPSVSLSHQLTRCAVYHCHSVVIRTLRDD